MSATEEFFQRVHERYLTASESSGGPYMVTFEVGSKVIRLYFASPALISLIAPAFRHLNLPNNSSNADLDVYLWDSKSTGVPMVKPPWGNDAFLPKGAIKGFSDGFVRATYLFDRKALSLFNLRTDKAIYWVPDAHGVPYFETGAPLLGILPQWFLEKGKLFMHGGAIGIEDKGVLLVGPGGSGKSTTAIRCLNDFSLYYLADDYCLVNCNDPVYIHSVYCSGKLDPVQVESFSFLEPALYNPHTLHEEKALFFLYPLFAHRLLKTVPLKAIFIPQITRKGRTFLSPASPIDAFRALTPSTLFQLPGFGHTASEMIAKLVRKVPAYYLNLGDDPEIVPKVIHDYLIRRL